MLGYEKEEMVGKSLFNFMDDEAREDAQKKVACRRKGIKEIHDFKFRRKDGTPLWAIVSTNPILDEKGNYQGALGMITDISDRKRMEENLRRSKDYLNSILVGTYGGLMVLDRDFTITDVNPRCLEMYNGKGEAVIGQKCHALTHKLEVPCDRIGGDCPGRQVLETGAPAKAEHHHLNHKGEDIITEIYAFPLFDDTGKVERIAEMHHDITEHKMAESALKKSEKALTGIDTLSSMQDNCWGLLYRFSKMCSKRNRDRDRYRNRDRKDSRV